MPVVFTKILLRTKVSGLVTHEDLVDREIVFGDVEKCIFVRDPQGVLHKFGAIDDSKSTSDNVWSAQKVAQAIGQLSGEFVKGEQPIGDIDGFNVIFQTQHPFEQGTLEVYLNGLRLTEGIANDYVINSNTQFTMNYPPLAGDELRVDYWMNV